MSTAPKTLVPPTGMGREVGLLFAQLEEARARTRTAVHGISTADLDAELPGSPYTIGMLLFHVAGVEYWWMHRVLCGEEIEPGVEKEFAPARLDSADALKLRGHDVGYYLGVLDEVRAKTESVCWRLPDEALERECYSPEDGKRYSGRYVLAHLCDHEAEHRGALLLLKRLIQARAR